MFERKSNILNKQATIFSTNYDLFIEKIAAELSESIIFNDVFNRLTSLTNTYRFSPQDFFNAVSYIDKITAESIPILSIGTCVFSRISTPMPLKLKIEELPDEQKADSHNFQFEKISRFP